MQFNGLCQILNDITGVNKVNTKILKINVNSPEADKIEYAAKALKEGGTVAFPTETVYGLGADALNTEAVKKIFEAKGRPADNPLIVHISKIEEVDKLVESVSNDAKKLMSAFWPGPLTIIMKKSNIIPQIITAGLDTVAIRLPSHPIARELIKTAGIPIAAPSANISGKPSPTIAQHVVDDLFGKVDVIIDGGTAAVGLESTVIDMSSEVPALLRPGGITYEHLREILGDVQIDPAMLSKINADVIPRSPGMKYTHYSPNAEVVIVEGEKEKVVNAINQLVEIKRNKGLKVGVMALDETVKRYKADYVFSVGSENKPETIAANLFYKLREFDQVGVNIIFAQSVSEKGIGMAIRNRLNKAAGYNIIKV
ncbi:MAG: L-threonylcarbamoyladenylate synthase [Clostridiales bacterium]|jgi:L-threonylcarbamoyladenylate synthase|nr:L-threonylcarbamoyladenylate synthase [Clostridiales bacterium]MDK2932510.1 L-threonylcarbamoyladenylate synthase [Clostridiales bacterium]